MNNFTPNISSILLELIRKKGLSISEIARRTNIPQPTIYRIAQGTHKKPHKKTLEALSDFFNIKVDQLIGVEPLNLINESFTLQIPILDYKQILNWPNMIDSVEYIIFEKKISSYAFALKVEDKSLEPLIKKNSLLIIDPEKIPGYRSLIVVKLHNLNEIVVRQLIKDGNNCYIRPLNQDLDHFEIRLLTDQDSIKGTVVEARLNFDEF